MLVADSTHWYVGATLGLAVSTAIWTIIHPHVPGCGAGGSKGDRRIELHGNELDDALRLASKLLGLDDAHGRTLLRRLDRFDGRLDGVIDLVDTEYYSAIDDPERLMRDLAPPPTG